jgi:hypothetical protein
VRCLYCGETSWRPFRWMADGEFCSREHRHSYQQRLRKVAVEFAKCQSAPAKATNPADTAVVIETTSAQLEPTPEVCAELLPMEVPGVLAAASVYGGMALANKKLPDALLQTDLHPVGLQSPSLLPLWINDDQAHVDKWQPLPVVSAAGRAVPAGSSSGMLPAGFENHARIKRWGLRIKFPKV